MAIFSKVTSFWEGLSITSNVKKMRKVLMEYFKEEGIACEVKDGNICFTYRDTVFFVNFMEHDYYAECGIVYECSDEGYSALSEEDKTFIADKVNTDLTNHAVTLAYNDTLKVVTMFYFSSEKMLLELFAKHFDELNEAIGMALDIAADKIGISSDEETGDEEKPRKVGFCMPNEGEANEMRVTAKKG